MKGVRTIKKTVNVMLIVMILFVNVVHAVPALASTDELSDDEAFAVGAMVTASQGGQVNNSPSFYEKMNQLGNDIVNNALANGKRFTDIIIRNGNEIMINPSSIIDVIGDTWTQFANTELTWVTNNRIIISVGANGNFPPDWPTGRDRVAYDYRNYGASFVDNGEWVTATIYGRNLNDPTMEYRRVLFFPEDAGDGRERVSLLNITDNTPSHKITLSAIQNRGIYIGRLHSRESGTIVNVNRIVITPGIEGDPAPHIPTNTVPTKRQIERNFSSTFKESFEVDEENEQAEPVVIQPNLFYSYDMTTITNSSTIIDNYFLQENYSSTTIIESETPPDESETPPNENEAPIIHEPDESGGGTFWTALLNLLGTIISSLANLGSSIANAIGMLFEPLFSLIGNIFDWLTWFDTDYMTESFNTINTQFSDKFPDFSNIIDTNQSIGTEPPDMTVNFSFMGLGNQTVINISPLTPYFPYIKNILRAFIWLSTIIIIFVKITGGGLND